MSKRLGGYQGNPLLRISGIQTSFTQAQLEEFNKCRENCIYFIEKYCKIITMDYGLQSFILREYQKRFLYLMLDNKKVIARTGKTEWQE